MNGDRARKKYENDSNLGHQVLLGRVLLLVKGATLFCSPPHLATKRMERRDLLKKQKLLLDNESVLVLRKTNGGLVFALPCAGTLALSLVQDIKYSGCVWLCWEGTPVTAGKRSNSPPLSAFKSWAPSHPLLLRVWPPDI